MQENVDTIIPSMPFENIALQMLQHVLVFRSSMVDARGGKIYWHDGWSSRPGQRSNQRQESDYLQEYSMPSGCYGIERICQTSWLWAARCYHDTSPWLP